MFKVTLQCHIFFAENRTLLICCRVYIHLHFHYTRYCTVYSLNIALPIVCSAQCDTLCHLITFTFTKVWKRFIDDIFVIWTHGIDSLNQFIYHLNNCLPSIKFEADVSITEIHFLDMTVSLDEQHNIQTDLYTKPTDTHNYLKYNSAHPRHCRDGIPYSQFLRLKRICSKEETFVHQCREMSKFFIKADYPPGVIRKAMKESSALIAIAYSIPPPSM